MKTLLNPARKALLGALVGLASSWAAPAAATPLALIRRMLAGTRLSTISIS